MSKIKDRCGRVLSVHIQTPPVSERQRLASLIPISQLVPLFLRVIVGTPAAITATVTMAPLLNTLSLIVQASLIIHSSPTSAAAIDRQPDSAAKVDKRSVSQYAPTSVSCPANVSLVRPGSDLSESESSYITSRKTKADAALTSWLEGLDSSFPTTSLPSLGLALTGGGLRATLIGAGIVQALDSRDSNAGTSGLFQSLTYLSALSGGGWLTGSLAGNDWPTVSTLKESLWHENFQDSLLDPAHLLATTAYLEIVTDIIAKAETEAQVSIVDVYGRLLGYQFLKGSDGGVAKTFSGLASNSNFTESSVGTSHLLFGRSILTVQVPFPILTARGLEAGACIIEPTSPQYEYTPYEFGSWDAGISAFTPIEYLGSHLTGGSPTTPGKCVSNYDNLAFVMGTSSNVFNGLCTTITPVNSTSDLVQTLEAIVARAHEALERDLYALVPNPFYNYDNVSVAGQSELHIVDGGELDQAVPLWPL